MHVIQHTTDIQMWYFCVLPAMVYTPKTNKGSAPDASQSDAALKHLNHKLFISE